MGLKPTARIKSENARRVALLTGAAKSELAERRKILQEAGLVPRPAPRPQAKIMRRVVRVCPGVKINPSGWRRGFERKCGKKILLTLVSGRPPARCPECRVLKWWWKYFYRVDPVPVILVLKQLMAKGIIGSGQYRKAK